MKALLKSSALAIADKESALSVRLGFDAPASNLDLLTGSTTRTTARSANLCLSDYLEARYHREDDACSFRAPPHAVLFVLKRLLCFLFEPRRRNGNPNPDYFPTRSAALRPAHYILIAALAASLVFPVGASAADEAALHQRITELELQLAEARRQLASDAPAMLPADSDLAPPEADPLPVTDPEVDVPRADKITLGPVTIGGAMRLNYILGDYEGGGPGPNNGGNGGNFSMDTFIFDAALDYQSLIGQFTYRFYDGYNFIVAGWLGWDFDDGSQLQVGVNRVPFGPGPYGVSQSWFFDQHFYVGLSDDPDLGIKYTTELGNWNLDFAYYYSSEWNGNGTSQDATRYGYDAVVWDSAIDENGDVVPALPNGYNERNQFNLRAIYALDDINVPSELGVSLQYGELDGRRADNGSHWAASVHMKNSWNNWLLATQLTRYKYDIDSDNALGTDELIPMGAFNFAWPVATDAWVPAISLSYLNETNRIPWLDSVRPYLEYSSIIKQDTDYNDSSLAIAGAAWASGGWYIFTDLAYSNGNYFVGNRGDNYSNVFDGVGDFGVNGNDRWNYSLHLNFGYYF